MGIVEVDLLPSFLWLLVFSHSLFLALLVPASAIRPFSLPVSVLAVYFFNVDAICLRTPFRLSNTSFSWLPQHAKPFARSTPAFLVSQRSFLRFIAYEHCSPFTRHHHRQLSIQFTLAAHLNPNSTYTVFSQRFTCHHTI